MSLAIVAEQAQSEPTTEPQISRRVNPLRLALFPARIFLALGWARAGVEKLIDADWWRGVYLRDFLVEAQDAGLPFALSATNMIGPRLAVVVSFVVLVAEVVLAFCLLTGRRLRPALIAACALNVAFIALGAVTPSAFYLVLQLTLLLAAAPALSTPALSATTPSATGPGRADPRQLVPIGTCVLTAVALAPFVRTLHPHDVIEDPAIMLATLALLVAATLTIRLFEPHVLASQRR